jgi:hypothetical protein
MIPNGALIEVLRSLGFEFKRQADRVMLYKQRGTDVRVGVRRNQMHDEDYARTVLRLAGMPADKIEDFIRQARQ